MVRLLFVILALWMYFVLGSNGQCCRDVGAVQGLLCGCRSSCAGTSCDAGNFGDGAACGNGVCCCGNGCNKPLKPELDSCPTQEPSIDPTPSPSRAPTRSPSIIPSSNPSSNPSTNPTRSPSSNPSVSPTVPQCAEWNAAPSEPTTNPADIPAPDISQSPQLCQLGKNGEWNSLDRWYSWDCSCYDTLTLFKLNQFIHGWFYEMQISFNEQQEGRFESYFDNYSHQDIFMKTSLSDEPENSGPQWDDLQSLTSCDPANPGYAELTRQVAQTMDYQISPGGIFIRECTANGNVAYAQLKIDNYRIRDGITENQVAFGDFIVKREQDTNIWLIKEIIFTGQTVGYLQQDQP